jgi:5'-methylthioadenosine phosphorylase
MPTDLKIGIIGGSGMEDPAFIDDYSSKAVSTPYGDPSSKLIIVKNCRCSCSNSIPSWTGTFN